MAEFNLRQAINWVEIAASHRFEGLKNTQELKDTVCEMLNGASISVTHVQGQIEKFKCSMTSSVKTDVEIAHLISTFEKNTYVTTKRDKYK